MMIALKGENRDFFLQSPHCAPNCLKHVRSSGPGAIVCKSCATHRALITCNMSCATWYEGTVQLSSLTEFNSHFFFFFFFLLKRFGDEGGEETGVPGEKTGHAFEVGRADDRWVPSCRRLVNYTIGI